MNKNTYTDEYTTRNSTLTHSDIYYQTGSKDLALTKTDIQNPH